VALIHLQEFRQPDNVLEEEAWGIILYGLIPQVVCLLGLLLWVSPLRNTELEGRTWTYLAVRPGGKTAVLLGKYFNGVLWTAATAILGLTLAFYVGQPTVYDRTKLYAVLCLLICCSCCAYGAVYALLGVLFPRRAIVISVAYMLILEVLVSNIPAVISKVTIQFRLLSILLISMNWTLPSRARLSSKVTSRFGGTWECWAC
jgi:ABC-type transport system involved in multi-copper enzyme maturation permease subunit